MHASTSDLNQGFPHYDENELKCTSYESMKKSVLIKFTKILTYKQIVWSAKSEIW